MKFNRQFYKTNSVLFGLVLISAPTYNLLTSQDQVGRLLNIGCQIFGLIFLVACFFKREH